MNSCFGGNSCLWILIIALILGTNVLNSKALSGCGWPLIVALAYCMCKNGTLQNVLGRLGLGGCGCNNG